ncbi:hypothetical protein [Fructobacillus parabroussonetiae]|uniref:Uncharacterized protein n=1 Tax=Fructobacillus parabroussonetiae TaxID=2713174 RepID=A0ABS5QWW6_9LACO|nr:hypothetical protein [Fructobacillus parabroussonetiae]MBS9337693.1 hypothetical protein [Fructobacillus parabroussonetiae]
MQPSIAFKYATKYIDEKNIDFDDPMALHGSIYPDARAIVLNNDLLSDDELKKLAIL